MLRPEYKSPSAYQLGSPNLDNLHDEIKEDCRYKIKDQAVHVSLDGSPYLTYCLLQYCYCKRSILVTTVVTGVNFPYRGKLRCY